MAPLTYFFGGWNPKTWFLCEDFKEKKDMFRKTKFSKFLPVIYP